MPLKDVVKNETLETFKKQIQELEEKIEGKKDKELVENKELSSLHFKLNMLRSSSISLESLLKLNDDKTIAKAMVTDDRSAQMVRSISTALLNQTMDKKSEIMEFNKLLAELESKKSQ
ncbi:hypothetical protein [Mycoplasma yeatsii]|uniref:hypothetical protein n=1 Tax=Mycoplasma yeatsii TaxID=51365 RepID=UPI0003A70F1C|nr:hypothetical protein [Mycoplasma yeatsii]